MWCTVICIIINLCYSFKLKSGLDQACVVGQLRHMICEQPVHWNTCVHNTLRGSVHFWLVNCQREIRKYTTITKCYSKICVLYSDIAMAIYGDSRTFATEIWNLKCLLTSWWITMLFSVVVLNVIICHGLSYYSGSMFHSDNQPEMCNTWIEWVIILRLVLSGHSASGQFLSLNQWCWRIAQSGTLLLGS